MPENSNCSGASSCSKESCEGCPSNAKNKAGGGIAKEPMNAASNVKKVIGVVSGKGGVGKSFVTASLAAAMNRAGYKVGIMDADITGPSIPRIFGLKEKATGDETGIYPVRTKTGIDVMSINVLLENETDPVVWRGPIIAGTVKQFWSDVLWSDVDYLFVDMPPGTGDVPLTVFQSLPVDGIIVVTSPQDLVSMIVEKAVKMAKLMDVPVLGLVQNMAYFECPDCGSKHYIFGENKADETAKEFSIDTVCEIPMNQKLAAACDKGAIELFEGNWLDKMADKVEKTL